MAKTKPNLRIGKRRVKGEPWVWLSGGAVATGIVMIIGMLLLIGFEGMVAFWPHNVEAIALGEPRFHIQHEEKGAVWVSRDDKRLLVQSDDAYRLLDDKPFTDDAGTLRPASLRDYRENPTRFDESISWVLREADGNLAVHEGGVITPKSYLDNLARQLLAIGKNAREHYYGISVKILTPETKFSDEQLTKLFDRLTVEHPERGPVFIDSVGGQLALKVPYKYFDGTPVELDAPKPRRATISDYREFGALFEGNAWLLTDTQGNVVRDGERPLKAKAFIDNPDKYPSPWGYLNEEGKHVPIETLMGDDRWRDHKVLVGTVRGEREMDVRELPPNEDGTPIRVYQLDETPQEELIRQGNQGEDLYGRGAYFRWVRTNLPELDTLRRQNASAYAEVALNRTNLPNAMLIERLEKGVLTGFVTRVTVEGEVVADVEKDGLARVYEVFHEQQQEWYGKYKQRYELEKYDLGDVNEDIKYYEDTLKRIRYENEDSRAAVMALDDLEAVFQKWQAMEPLDKDYDTTEKYDVAREQWLEEAPGTFDEWAGTLGKYDLSERDQTALDRAREVQEERADTMAKDFARLRYEVNRLRANESNATFTFRTPDGLESELALAHVVRAFEPNEKGFFGKFGVYGSRIWEFLTEDPREANTEGGIWPVIIGTLVMVLLMTFAVVPFGVIAALYLREYAKQGPIVSAVRIAVNNLAGVPSIVFGIFGLGFFCVMMGGTIDDLFFPELQPAPVFGGGGIMWAALTLALLTVPVVIVSTEEALSAVPSSQREASLACGASKFQTIMKVILPQALPGVLTGTILAMARGAGEVAPLMLVGAVKYAPYTPVDTAAPFVHLERKFMHLGFHIYDVGFQSPNVDNTKPLVFATALVLIILVAVLNIFAIKLRNRLRKKYATSAV